MIKNSLYIICFFLLLYSCKKDAVDKPVDMKYGYFPKDSGRYVDYSVDSIVWNDFYPDTDPRHLDTFRFKIRERLDSYFTDIQGNPAIRIVRYKKISDTTNWFLKDVWFANVTASKAEKVEENQRYIKLSFPVVAGKTWNGNAYNTFDDWEYEYQNIDKSMVMNGLTFDSTVVVQQFNQLTLINQIFSKEVYAKNVGMIYKEYTNVSTNPANMVITNGLKYKMQVIGYGKN